MKKISLLSFIIVTILFLYVGLFDELYNRYKFNQWDIIGAKGRVTNHNLYTNIYIRGIILFLVISYFIKLFKKYKSIK